MALSQPLYGILRWLFQKGLLPQNGAILEFGESNWYGDMSLDALTADIETLVSDPERRNRIISTIRRAASENNEHHLFTIVKAVYAALFNPSVVHSVDAHGTPAAFKFDLNNPIALADQYACTMNNGTAEHIFNVGQFFKTMHECTRPSGLMLHDGPFTGWVNHGFYTFQPTLYLDLAAANDYEMMAMFVMDWDAHRVEPIPDRNAIIALIKKSNEAYRSAGLVVALRKPASDRPFVMPFQGYYAGTLPPDERKAWEAGGGGLPHAS
jgi:hypothetical protein